MPVLVELLNKIERVRKARETFVQGEVANFFGWLTDLSMAQKSPKQSPKASEKLNPPQPVASTSATPPQRSFFGKAWDTISFGSSDTAPKASPQRSPTPPQEQQEQPIATEEPKNEEAEKIKSDLETLNGELGTLHAFVKCEDTSVPFSSAVRNISRTWYGREKQPATESKKELPAIEGHSQKEESRFTAFLETNADKALDEFRAFLQTEFKDIKDNLVWRDADLKHQIGKLEARTKSGILSKDFFVEMETGELGKSFAKIEAEIIAETPSKMAHSTGYKAKLDSVNKLEGIVQELLSRMKGDGVDILSTFAEMQQNNNADLEEFSKKLAAVNPLEDNYLKFIKKLVNENDAWPTLPDDFLNALNNVAEKGEATRAKHEKYFKEGWLVPELKSDFVQRKLDTFLPDLHMAGKAFAAACNDLLDYIKSNQLISDFRSQTSPALVEEFRQEMLAAIFKRNPKLKEICKTELDKLVTESMGLQKSCKAFNEAIKSAIATYTDRKQQLEELNIRLKAAKKALSDRCSVALREENLEEEANPRHLEDKIAFASEEEREATIEAVEQELGENPELPLESIHGKYAKKILTNFLYSGRSKQLFDELRAHARGHASKEAQINEFIQRFTTLLNGRSFDLRAVFSLLKEAQEQTVTPDSKKYKYGLVENTNPFAWMVGRTYTKTGALIGELKDVFSALVAEERKNKEIYKSMSAVVQGAKEELFDPKKKCLDYRTTAEELIARLPRVSSNPAPAARTANKNLARFTEQLLAIDCTGSEASKFARLNVAIDFAAKAGVFGGASQQSAVTLKDSIQDKTGGVDASSSSYPFSCAHQILKMRMDSVKTDRTQTLRSIRREVDALVASDSKDKDEVQKHLDLLKIVVRYCVAIKGTRGGSPGKFNNGSGLYISLKEFLDLPENKTVLDAIVATANREVELRNIAVAGAAAA